MRLWRSVLIICLRYMSSWRPCSRATSIIPSVKRFLNWSPMLQHLCIFGIYDWVEVLKKKKRIQFLLFGPNHLVVTISDHLSFWSNEITVRIELTIYALCGSVLLSMQSWQVNWWPTSKKIWIIFKCVLYNFSRRSFVFSSRLWFLIIETLKNLALPITRAMSRILYPFIQCLEEVLHSYVETKCCAPVCGR